MTGCKWEVDFDTLFLGWLMHRTQLQSLIHMGWKVQKAGLEFFMRMVYTKSAKSKGCEVNVYFGEDSDIITIQDSCSLVFGFGKDY